MPSLSEDRSQEVTATTLIQHIIQQLFSVKCIPKGYQGSNQIVTSQSDIVTYQAAFTPLLKMNGVVALYAVCIRFAACTCIICAFPVRLCIPCIH